jgi:hypothetical protein
VRRVVAGNPKGLCYEISRRGFASSTNHHVCVQRGVGKNDQSRDDVGRNSLLFGEEDPRDDERRYRWKQETTDDSTPLLIVNDVERSRHVADEEGYQDATHNPPGDNQSGLHDVQVQCENIDRANQPSGPPDGRAFYRNAERKRWFLTVEID